MKLIFVTISLLLFLYSKSQDTIEYKNYKYIGFVYTPTLNHSFVNKALLFVKNSDTVVINQKLPFNLLKKEIFNEGVYYNCRVDSNKIYSLVFKKISQKIIPDNHVNYYKINASFSDSSNSSKFKEFSRNTEFKYYGNYMKYFDINWELVEILNITPKCNCRFEN
jgi:hypothetical protein